MEGKILFSRYKILNVIGKGSFSYVYKAIDLNKKDINSFVAIKVIDMNTNKLSQSDKKTDTMNDTDFSIKKKQLLQEIEIARKVHHPNIVECFDFFQGESNNVYFLVMEYFPEGTLLDYLKSCGKCLNEKKACHFFKQMVSAVSYLHSKNTIHRDIKFENFVIIGSDKIKLIDFGFSFQYTECDDSNVNKSVFCGSLAYSPPETILHSKYTFSVDIWSLGVVLFGMIFGTFPFQGHGEVLANEILTSSTYFPKPISKELKNLITEMLRKNPRHRLTIEQVENHKWLTMNGCISNSKSQMTIEKSPLIDNSVGMANADFSVSRDYLPQFCPAKDGEADKGSLFSFGENIASIQANSTSVLSFNPFLDLDLVERKRCSTVHPRKILAQNIIRNFDSSENEARHKRQSIHSGLQTFILNHDDANSNIFLQNKNTSPLVNNEHPNVRFHPMENKIKEKNPFIKDSDFVNVADKCGQKKKFINSSLSLTFK